MDISKHAEEHGNSRLAKIELDLAKLMQRKDKIVKQLTRQELVFYSKKIKLTHIQWNQHLLLTIKHIKVASICKRRKKTYQLKILL